MGSFRACAERRSLLIRLRLEQESSGLSVTLLYASGYLWAGALVALAVGVFDGVDGKVARLKVQTTRIGKGEHVLDYCIEMSWWAALGYHFHVTSQVDYASAILFSSFPATCSTVWPSGLLNAVSLEAWTMPRDSIGFFAMSRAVAIFIPGCSPVPSSSDTRRMVSF